jgi:hypothetical protein
MSTATAQLEKVKSTLLADFTERIRIARETGDDAPSLKIEWDGKDAESWDEALYPAGLCLDSEDGRIMFSDEIEDIEETDDMSDDDRSLLRLCKGFTSEMEVRSIVEEKMNNATRHIRRDVKLGKKMTKPEFTRYLTELEDEFIDRVVKRVRASYPSPHYSPSDPTFVPSVPAYVPSAPPYSR